MAVRECQTELNDFEQIDIALQRLIMVFRLCFEGPHGTCHYTRKLSVLTKWIVVTL